LQKEPEQIHTSRLYSGLSTFVSLRQPRQPENIEV